MQFKHEDKVGYDHSEINYEQQNVILKDFYSIAEFYKFIKNPSNAPITSRFFTVVPFYITNLKPDSTANENGKKSRGRGLFSNFNLYRFALSIQKIELTNFCMNAGNIDSTINVNTPIGAFSGMNNTTLFVSGNEIKFTFLEMNFPIIEMWIHEWFLACLSTKHGNRENWEYPFPRLNIAIKYYNPLSFTIPAEIRANKNIKTVNVFPDFIYWITGLYPNDIESYQFDMASR